MPNSLRLIVVSVAVATACSLAVVVAVSGAARPAVLVTTPSASSASSNVVPEVAASGDATVSKRPDIAYLYMGVESQQSTAAAAQTDLATKAGKLISRAKSLGVADKDIATSGYSIGPYYASGSQTISGYTASEQLSLKWRSVDTAGKTLDSLVQQGGATQVGVSFGLADPKAAQAEARALAIADARTKAQAMASAAGVKLGAVLRVSDLTAPIYPMYGNAASKSASDATYTQLPVGQMDVTVTVQLDYGIA